MSDAKTLLKSIQRELGVVADGVWGPITAKAVAARVLNNDPVKVIPSSSTLLRCPFANQYPTRKTAGVYEKGYPEGAVVHWTAGRRNGVDAGMSIQAGSPYTYFVIDESGVIGQNFNLDRWGYHTGKSSWPLEGASAPSHTERPDRYLVGIEVMSPGVVDRDNKSWFGETYQNSEITEVKTKNLNIAPGRYVKFTVAQQASLRRLLRWLHDNNKAVFNFDYVFGHDEVSPGRKVDPGASLGMTMQDFRRELKGES